MAWMCGSLQKERPAAPFRVAAGPITRGSRHPDRVFPSSHLPEFYFLQQRVPAAQLAPLMTLASRPHQLRFYPTPTTPAHEAALGFLDLPQGTPVSSPAPLLSRPELCLPSRSGSRFFMPRCPALGILWSENLCWGVQRMRQGVFCSDPVPNSLLFYVQRTRSRGLNTPSMCRHVLHSITRSWGRTPGSPLRHPRFQPHPLGLCETLFPSILFQTPSAAHTVASPLASHPPVWPFQQPHLTSTHPCAGSFSGTTVLPGSALAAGSGLQGPPCGDQPDHEPAGPRGPSPQAGFLAPSQPCVQSEGRNCPLMSRQEN